MLVRNAETALEFRRLGRPSIVRLATLRESRQAHPFFGISNETRPLRLGGSRARRRSRRAARRPGGMMELPHFLSRHSAISLERVRFTKEKERKRRRRRKTRKERRKKIHLAKLRTCMGRSFWRKGRATAKRSFEPLPWVSACPFRWGNSIALSEDYAGALTIWSSSCCLS